MSILSKRDGIRIDFKPSRTLVKKGEKIPWFGRAEFHEGAVVLPKLSFVKGSAVAAYLCRDCEKVIIDYSKENTDFNAT